jgi:RNA-directed DNA polymerase
LRYTRYADDLTFSGEKIGQDTIEYVYRVLRDFKFEPNLKMTRLLRRSQRQIVTGLVVNEKLQAPREVRRKLRQHAYFIKKFGIEDHAAFTEITNAHFKEHLLGCAGFVKSVNANDRDAIALIDALKFGILTGSIEAPAGIPNWERLCHRSATGKSSLVRLLSYLF